MSDDKKCPNMDTLNSMSDSSEYTYFGRTKIDTKDTDCGRDRLFTNVNHADNVSAIRWSLSRKEILFMKGDDLLVRSNGAFRVVESGSDMATTITRHIQNYEEKKDEDDNITQYPTMLKMELASLVAKSPLGPSEHINEIRHNIAFPVFYNGAVVSGSTGYHWESKNYVRYRDIDGTEISAKADAMSVADAVSYLKSVLSELPFAEERDMWRAVLLPMSLMTRMTMVESGAPFHFYVASEAGAGKTFTASMLLELILGYKVTPSNFQTNKAEFEKEFHANLRSGEVYGFYDNLREGSVVNDNGLLPYATSPSDKMIFRPLYGHVSCKVDTTATLVFTCINSAFSAEVGQRSIIVNLTSKDLGNDREKTFEGIAALIKSQRAQIIAALVTILKAEPAKVEETRFPSWSKAVLAPLVTAIGYNPLEGWLANADRDDYRTDARIDLVEKVAQITLQERGNDAGHDGWLTLNQISLKAENEIKEVFPQLRRHSPLPVNQLGRLIKQLDGYRSGDLTLKAEKREVVDNTTKRLLPRWCVRVEGLDPAEKGPREEI